MLMYGFTIIGRDGGEEYTSEAEYEDYDEAYCVGELYLFDINGGSVEVWSE
jgi:hypothetical protein